jgi:hypothetical protein
VTRRSNLGRLSRDAARVGVLAAAMPGATAVTLAHRLPMLAGLGSTSALTQTAEVWRMTLEKPVAFWQSWLAGASLPLQLWSLWARGAGQPDLPLRLAGAGVAAMRAGLAPLHAGVTGNARRLSRTRRRAGARTRSSRARSGAAP